MTKTRETDNELNVRLNDYIARAQQEFSEKGFRWGEFDCATFGLGWWKETTGVDVMKDFRDKYKTAKEAAEALRKHGEGTFYKTLVKRLGKPSDDVLHAISGDLCWREPERCLGIVKVIGARTRGVFLYEDTETGKSTLGFMNLRDCQRIWKLSDG